MKSVQELFQKTSKWGHTPIEIYSLVDKTKSNIHKEIRGLTKRKMLGRIELKKDGYLNPIIIYTKVRT